MARECVCMRACVFECMCVTCDAYLQVKCSITFKRRVRVRAPVYITFTIIMKFIYA